MTCRDYDVLVSLHAAGALDPSESARVEAHLAGCTACRADAGELGAALGLAKLPPVSEAERRAFQDLGDRILAALRRSARVRSLAKRLAAGFAVAAAAAAVLLAPAALRREPAPAPVARDVWQQPDLDAIWSDSAVLDLDAWGSADAAVSGSADAAVSGQDADYGADDPETDAVLAAIDM